MDGDPTARATRSTSTESWSTRSATAATDGLRRPVARSCPPTDGTPHPRGARVPSQGDRQPDNVPPGWVIAIPDDIRAFIDDIRFATIATTDPDGAPRQAVVWYTVEGDEIVLNSAVGRRWPANLLRDPRVALSVVDASDGYRWVGLTGRVTVVDDQATAQADIAGMARRYHRDDPDKAERLIQRQFERQARISFRMGVLTVTRHFD